MDDVAHLPAVARAELFQAAADDRGLLPALIEKDFWVCWTLKRIFTLDKPPAGLIFKGGTSLSKAFHVIDRFSEDVDLSFDRVALGFGGDKDPAKAASGKKAEKQVDALFEACTKMIHEQFLPMLKLSFEKSLGTAPSSRTWDVTIDKADEQCLIFTYPRAVPAAEEAGPRYVPQWVRLELGARGEIWPAQDATIISYAAQSIPAPFKAPECGVKVLGAERTFWEKACILHMLYHTPEGKKLPERQSRHYYDFAQLYEKGPGKAALKDMALLKKVVEHNKVFFRLGAAKYQEAVPGTLRLSPPEHRMKEIEADYIKMREMIFGSPPNLYRILEVVREIEHAINKPKA